MQGKEILEILEWDKNQMQDIRLIGHLYIEQGKYEFALDLFKGLHALDPTNIFDLQTLGALYLQLGRGLDALSYLDLALKVDPSDANTQMNRAKALFSLGYRKQAVRQLLLLIKNKDKSLSLEAKALLTTYS